MTSYQLQLLDELLEKEEGLSGSEMDFIESLHQGWRDSDLTEKQLNWFNSIVKRLGLES